MMVTEICEKSTLFEEVRDARPSSEWSAFIVEVEKRMDLEIAKFTEAAKNKESSEAWPSKLVVYALII